MNIKSAAYPFLAVVLLLGTLQAGCVNTPSMVDQTSPRAVLASYQEAVERRDYSVIVACNEPWVQPEYSKMLSSLNKFCTKASSFEKLVRRRFGKQAALEFREEFTNKFKSLCFPLLPWSGRIGNVDWERIELTTTGNMTYASIDGEEAGPVAKNIGGIWYVAVGDRPKGTRPATTNYRRLFDALVRTLESMTVRLDKGTIDKDSLMQLLFEDI